MNKEKNWAAYAALFLLVFLACIPPIDFFISNPSHDLWFVMILVAGFFGFYTAFLKVPCALKIISIWSYILCFFSSSPYISFTSYVSIILSCYFYIMCLRIKNWKIIFHAFQSLLFLNILLIIMQNSGQDSLLNFGLYKDFTCFGVIGQHMQMGSFAVVLSAVLLTFSRWNIFFPFVVAFFCTSTWTILCAGVGLFVWLSVRYRKLANISLLIILILFFGFSLKTDKFTSNMHEDSGRFVVWQKSLGFASQKLWTGWGAGTYKELYPPLSKSHNIPYKTAHNWIIQLLFEMGLPFTLFILMIVLDLFLKLYKAREFVLLAGLGMIFCDMMVHFPDRMAQTVWIIVCFMAYCRVQLQKNFV